MSPSPFRTTLPQVENVDVICAASLNLRTSRASARLSELNQRRVRHLFDAVAEFENRIVGKVDVTSELF
jgi:hypothetical protein